MLAIGFFDVSILPEAKTLAIQNPVRQLNLERYLPVPHIVGMRIQVGTILLAHQNHVRHLTRNDTDRSTRAH